MINVDSISILHELLGAGKPKHPLITLIKFNDIHPDDKIFNETIKLHLYMISLKNNPDCEFLYGRKYYDFTEGSLIFAEPGQILRGGEYRKDVNIELDGWTLCFHPDMIKGSSLWRGISEYSFFEYEANEALHLSDFEREAIEGIVNNIKSEYSGNLDCYSKDLIVSNIQLLLNYSKRFYGRQFITRTTVYKEAVMKFEELLQERCSVENLEKLGAPKVKELAQVIGYSPNYLSDMLKKETGKTVQEYIKLQILEVAEGLLLNTEEPIYQIAEKLGFEQPSSFTKFMKVQLGVSPVDFRKQHNI